MNITFKQENGWLVLHYSPENDLESILHKMYENGGIPIKRAFWVSKDQLLQSEEDLSFRIGKINDDYIKLDPKVTMTEHTFYFSKDINFTHKLFIASRNIAILPKIDKLINRDFYVSTDSEKEECFPYEEYLQLIKHFPTTTEMDKYVDARIGNSIKEYFPECDKYQEIYEKYFERKSKKSNKPDKADFTHYGFKIELETFESTLELLEEMLKNDEAYGEKEWQKKIKDILLLLYPKYIRLEREIKLNGTEKHEKQPDYVLLDSNGFIDVMEIKKPAVKLLRERQYRNNYIPTVEFSGGVQQLEKYIVCISTIPENLKIIREKLGIDNSDGIKATNPQGIFLAGRSNSFDKQQRNDFEIIKRQYKNVVDIMTYDDLIKRIKNVIEFFKNRAKLQNSE